MHKNNNYQLIVLYIHKENLDKYDALVTAESTSGKLEILKDAKFPDELHKDKYQNVFKIERNEQ